VPSAYPATRSSCSAWGVPGRPRDPLPPPTPRLPGSDVLTIAD